MLSSIRIVTMLGIMLGVGGGIYMYSHYLWLSDDVSTIQDLMVDPKQREFIISKFDEYLVNNENRSVIIDEMQSCYELDASFKEAMMSIVFVEKEHAFWGGILYFLFAIMFGLVMINNQKKSND